MFTGIIQELAEVASVDFAGGGGRFEVLLSNRGDIAIGESICVNGVCLTVRRLLKGAASFDVLGETLNLTALKNIKRSEKVNIERALRPSDRMGGHFVTGHIDGTGRVLAKEKSPGGARMRFSIPPGCGDLIVRKGSVAVDGISLTVTEVTLDAFGVALIPHTLENTTLGFREAGDEVNIETDIIGKYVLKLLGRRGSSGAITEEWLREKGF